MLFTGCTPQNESNLQPISTQSETKVPKENSGEMIVHFIDVGQGDSTLIQTPNGKAILIDAGEYTVAERVVAYIKEQGILTIDVLIATHPHSDHVGGMAEVIKNFNIGKI